MNNCQDYFVYMNQYLDGELSQQETDELMQHMEICESCRRRFEVLHRFTEETRKLDAEPPETLHAAIMARIRRERAAKRRRIFVRLGGLVACLALLVVLADVASPWMSRTGNASDTSGATTDGAAAPEAALFGADGASGASRSVDVYAQSAPESDNAADRALRKEDGGETAPEDAVVANDALGYDHELFVVSGLEETVPSAFYIVAVGTGDLSAAFGSDASIEQGAQGETCVLVENTENAQAEAEQTLISAGFTVCDNVEGLPATDGSAETGLVVVYEHR